jgi:hypothetical protein
MKAMNITEIREAAAAELERHVRIEDGCIVFTDAQGYSISLDRVGDEAAILRWTYHLASKPWVTLPILKHFILLCCEHHHLKYRGQL